MLSRLSQPPPLICFSSLPTSDQGLFKSFLLPTLIKCFKLCFLMSTGKFVQQNWFPFRSMLPSPHNLMERTEIFLYINNMGKSNAEPRSKLKNYYFIECPCTSEAHLFGQSLWFPSSSEGSESTSLQDLPAWSSCIKLRCLGIKISCFPVDALVCFSGRCQQTAHLVEQGLSNRVVWWIHVYFFKNETHKYPNVNYITTILLHDLMFSKYAAAS